MRTLLVGLIFLIVWGCNERGANEIAVPNESLPQVTLLGTFHFAGTTDYSSVEFDDLHSEKRQAEILEVVAKLTEFRPTKVMVEFPFDRTMELDSLYRSYQNGNHALSINEIEQLGFRVAAELNHPTIYAVDFPMSLPFGKLIDFANKNQPQEFQDFLKSVENQDSLETLFLQNHTIREYLSFRNTEQEDLRNRNQYLQETLQFVNDSSYIGAEFTAKWWERNIYILSHIERILEPEDRVLVIVGAAHRALLKDFLEDRSDMQYIEISEYLKATR